MTLIFDIILAAMCLAFSFYIVESLDISKKNK